MAEDQAQAVESVEDLAALMDSEPEEQEEVDSVEDDEQPEEQPALEDDPEVEAQDVEDEPEEETEEVEQEEDEQEEELWTIPASESTPEEQVTKEEAIAGYMRNKAYTQQRQQDAEEKRAAFSQATQAVQQAHQQAADTIATLEGYVYQALVPELQQLTPELANTDPAAYVALQSKQQQANAVMAQVQKAKQEQAQQAQQLEMAQRQELITQHQAALAESVPEFATEDYKQKLVSHVEQAYGIPQNDLAYLLAAPAFKDGGFLDSSLVVRILNDAMKFNQLQQQKPIARKKLNKAPKVVKPAAPKPKDRRANAKKRLKDTGSIDAFAELMG